jgi:hypothetical protein
VWDTYWCPSYDKSGPGRRTDQHRVQRRPGPRPGRLRRRPAGRRDEHRRGPAAPLPLASLAGWSPLSSVVCRSPVCCWR